MDNNANNFDNNIPMDIDANIQENVNVQEHANVNNQVENLHNYQREELYQLRRPRQRDLYRNQEPATRDRTLNDMITQMGIRNLHRYDCFCNIALAQRHALTNGEIDHAYFHYVCAGGTVEDIERWISNYINIHGYNSFIEFANEEMYNPTIGYNVTPIITAALWNSVDVLRLLYSFGLRLEQVDGLYPEEAIRNFRYAHPIAHLFMDDNVEHIFGYNINDDYGNNYRNVDEFRDIIDEILYISGELAPPVNWIPVAPRYQ